MTEQPHKSPQDCMSMQDVRQAIDALDEQLLDLLARRIEYIQQAARIKTSLESIRDDQRIGAIISKRTAQAEEHGYSGDLVETLFRALIEYSVEYETRLWKELNSAQ